MLLIFKPVGGAPEAGSGVVREQAPGIYVSVLPRMELVAGVLRQTAWMEEYARWESGGDYSRSVDRFFAPYLGHEAVQIAEDLLARGFAHDLPPNFAFRLGPLPQLEIIHPYDAHLARRAGSEAQLERFRMALIDLAAESGFTDFFEQNRNRFETAVEEVAADLDGLLMVQWLEGFYGWSAMEYHTILAPSLFPAGGYGATVGTADGELIMVGVIRTGDGPMQGETLAGLMLHEWGHSYVDPTLARHAREVFELQPLFEPVEGQMSDQLYTNVHTFVNEQVIRAIGALAMKDLYGRAAYERDLAVNEGRGFYLTRHLAEYLEENYRSQRDVFPTFVDFAPEIIAELASLDPTDFSPKAHLRINLRDVPFMLMGATVLIVVLWWFSYGLRRRRARIEQMDEEEVPPDPTPWT